TSSLPKKSIGFDTYINRYLLFRTVGFFESRVLKMGKVVLKKKGVSKYEENN
ncbi:39884_t:CDS:2, partial [Gigaspora margarita]